MTDLSPHRQQHALALMVAGAVLMGLAEVAGDDGPVHGGDDLPERDLLRWAGQYVPAADAALGAHQTSALERQQDLLEIGLRQAGALGDVTDRGGTVFHGVEGERKKGAAGVVAPR